MEFGRSPLDRPVWRQKKKKKNAPGRSAFSTRRLADQVRIQLERSGLAFLRLASDRLAERRQDRQTDRQTEKTNPREKEKKLVAHAEQRRPLGSKPQMPYK